MSSYIIRKKSRAPSTAPYAGPSCTRAGVQPGRIYTDFAEARTDADKLTEFNPVGFDVVEVVARTFNLSIQGHDGTWAIISTDEASAIAELRRRSPPGDNWLQLHPDTVIHAVVSDM